MTKQIHNLIIVDASGSMSHKREDVVGGINSLFQKIKEDEIQNEVENLTTITDFSSFGDFRMILNQRKSNELKNLTLEDYVTRGSTALFDAIGQSFAKIPNEAKHVFVSIITDGMENDS